MDSVLDWIQLAFGMTRGALRLNSDQSSFNQITALDTNFHSPSFLRTQLSLTDTCHSGSRQKGMCAVLFVVVLNRLLIMHQSQDGHWDGRHSASFHVRASLQIRIFAHQGQVNDMAARHKHIKDMYHTTRITFKQPNIQTHLFCGYTYIFLMSLPCTCLYIVA